MTSDEMFAAIDKLREANPPRSFEKPGFYSVRTTKLPLMTPGERLRFFRATGLRLRYETTEGDPTP